MFYGELDNFEKPKKVKDAEAQWMAGKAEEYKVREESYEISSGEESAFYSMGRIQQRDLRGEWLIRLQITQ